MPYLKYFDVIDTYAIQQVKKKMKKTKVKAFVLI